ncbi:MAG: carbohydrate binding domain-containing protein [Lachnospiraceae bacterium]|nr:carbohydrate binding domain-containing protein [Lachnospiraceae bacterium]
MKTEYSKRVLCSLTAATMLVAGACAPGAPSDEKTETTTTSTSDNSTLAEETTTIAETTASDTSSQTEVSEPKNYTINIDAADKVHDISDMLYGIFIEDINFAADGGLYAEMVQNRSFEFGSLAAGDELHAWSKVGSIDFKAVTDDAEGCLNMNNPNYAVLTNTSGSVAGIANRGFLDGLSITSGASYTFSIYARGLEGYTGPIYATLSASGKTAGEAVITAVSDTWNKYELTITSDVTASSGVSLNVCIDDGSVAIDMVSLFPVDTFNGRAGGLRRDLAEKLAALEPAFLRFPGGCVVEGVTLANAYDWKDSIGVDENRDPLLFNNTYGDVAARKQGQNIWTNENTSNDQNPSYMTYGLGFFEYFLLAEDIGAIGVPVINCGLECMAQGHGLGPDVGTEEFERYIDDALDLVEFCRGDETTVWGQARIAMGHEEPFELKYIGIGNEQWGEKFFDHYEAFVEAFEKAREENPEMYGDIELMFTAGTDDGDSGAAMYRAAYERMTDWLGDNPDKTAADYAGAIDHHYYNTPEWFLTHNDYYDETNYARSAENVLDYTYAGGLNVFLGEYAAQSNTLNAALAEASYMTGLERNGDIVVMAAYAPLFGNTTVVHWAPDLIWFNNNTSTASINYYVQQIFAINAGTTLLSSQMDGAEIPFTGLTGAVGVGTWSTSAQFSDITVTDNETGEVLAAANLTDESALSTEWTKVSDGLWSITDGWLVQSSKTTNTGKYSTTGTAAYFGDSTWSNYTLTMTARKTGGQEGFLIPFAVQDKDNNYFWNIGGWGNTVSCLQQVSGGTKSDQVAGTVKNCELETGVDYKLKIVVSYDNVKCYIDDRLYIDYDVAKNTKYECYHVVSTDETGDIIIKMVNVTGQAHDVAINIANATSISDTATVYQVAGQALTDDNILAMPEAVTLETFEITDISDNFTYTLPKYSVTVIRVHNTSN